MLSRFSGRCKGCNKPYVEGEDIYWTKEDGAWCWPCRETPEPPSAEQYALADRLAYIPSADLGRDGWPAVHAGWVLFRVLPEFVCPSAWRERSEARGRQSDLFGEE